MTRPETVWMHYAAAALAGIASREPDHPGTITDEVECAARYADVMLEEHEHRFSGGSKRDD